MTFMKFVDFDLCCFIPGKVIDEIFRLLRSVRKEKAVAIRDQSHSQPRPYEVLQELRDITSMAMEHFDEKIVPQLKSPDRLSFMTPVGGHPKYHSPALYVSLPSTLVSGSASSSFSTPQAKRGSGPSPGFYSGLPGFSNLSEKVWKRAATTSSRVSTVVVLLRSNC